VAVAIHLQVEKLPVSIHVQFEQWITLLVKVRDQYSRFGLRNRFASSLRIGPFKLNLRLFTVDVQAAGTILQTRKNF